MTRVLNFAYGSNMLVARIRARAPSARALCLARLPGHRLAWHKVGRDGSGKCDVVPTDERDAVVHGVVFELSVADKPALDRAEGLGNGYDEREISVSSSGGSIVCGVYLATATDERVRPFTWYKALVIAGARQHGLPTDYIAGLERQRAIVDADAARHAMNLALLAAD